MFGRVFKVPPKARRKRRRRRRKEHLGKKKTSQPECCVFKKVENVVLGASRSKQPLT
jgi:hypothetical protein